MCISKEYPAVAATALHPKKHQGSQDSPSGRFSVSAHAGMSPGLPVSRALASATLCGPDHDRSTHVHQMGCVVESQANSKGLSHDAAQASKVVGLFAASLLMVNTGTSPTHDPPTNEEAWKSLRQMRNDMMIYHDGVHANGAQRITD